MTPNAFEEKPVFFPCDNLVLAGILAVPSKPNGATVLLPWGAGAYPSSGRNRIRARLSRTLASEGFHSFRFDYRGVGESGGDYRGADLATPYTDDILAASDWLASQRLDRILIVGNCFGGFSSLMAAPRVQGLEGVVLLNAPVRRDHKELGAGEGSWRWWANKVMGFNLSYLRSTEYRAALRKMIAAKLSSLAGDRQVDDRYSGAVHYLLDSRIPVLFLYGEDDFRVDLELELDRGLRTAIERAGPSTRLVTVPERLQGCASLETQEILFDEVVPWLHEVAQGLPSATR